MDFQTTPLSTQEEGHNPQQQQQFFTQSMATPPRQQQHESHFNSPNHTQATPSNSSNISSQNSRHTPSIISISSSSPYQCSSGFGTEPGGSIFEQQSQLQSNSIVITPNILRGRGSSNQYLVIQQRQVQAPPESGVGRGGGQTATPKRGGGAQGGGDKETPQIPATPAKIVEETGKQNDEIQIVVDKGVNSGRRGGARSKRIDALLSSGPLVEMDAEDQRIIRTRENERKRRAAHKDSAEKLRNLVPGINDGKTRKVGEGIVMQKSADYIEKLLEDLKTDRSKDRDTHIELMRAIALNMINHHRLLNVFKELHHQSREWKLFTFPNFELERLAPGLHFITNQEVKDTLVSLCRTIGSKGIRVPGLLAITAAPPAPATPQHATGGSGGMQLQICPPGGAGVIKVQSSGAGFIPFAGCSQGQPQGSQICHRSAAIQQSSEHQQIVLPPVGKTSVRAQSQHQQGQGQQLSKILPVGYHGAQQQRHVVPRCVVGSQTQFRIGSAPISEIFTFQQRGSLTGQQVRVQLVRCAGGMLQKIASDVSENSVNSAQQIDHRMIGGASGQIRLSEPMSLNSLKQQPHVEEQQLTHRQSVEGAMEPVLGDLTQAVSASEKVNSGPINLLEIKSEPMDLDVDMNLNRVDVTGLQAIKEEVEDSGESTGRGELVSIKNEVEENVFGTFLETSSQNIHIPRK